LAFLARREGDDCFCLGYWWCKTGSATPLSLTLLYSRIITYLFGLPGVYLWGSNRNNVMHHYLILYVRFNCHSFIPHLGSTTWSRLLLDSWPSLELTV
jgi:hypothetical protein